MSPTKAQIIQAPSPLPTTLPRPAIFLSGSIDPAPPPLCWQSQLTHALAHLPIAILNPLRPDWNSSWVEDVSSPQFVQQVTWELDAAERADLVVVYLGSEAKAPISLLELGVAAGRGKRLVVCCPEGFWKRGNVLVLCGRMGVTVVGSLKELVREVKEVLGGMGVEGV